MVKQKASQAPEPNDSEEGGGLAVVDKEPDWLHEAHSEFIESETGEHVEPRAVQLVYGTRVAFRKTALYRERKQTAATAKAEAEATARAEREKNAAARAAEREAKAAAEKTRSSSSEALEEANKAAKATPAKKTGKAKGGARTAPF